MWLTRRRKKEEKGRLLACFSHIAQSTFAYVPLARTQSPGNTTQQGKLGNALSYSRWPGRRGDNT
jgi:hypothetical protein